MLDIGETPGLLLRNNSWGWTASGQPFVGCGSEKDPEHRRLPHYNSEEDEVYTKIREQYSLKSKKTFQKKSLLE